MQEKIIELTTRILPWVLSSGVKIIFILVGGSIVIQILKTVIEKTVRRLVRQREGTSKLSEEKRENTLIRVFNNAIKIIIWLIAVLMALSEAKVNIGPLLAAAGVAGIAFGFGGQYLIRDLITGFFIILENQYRVGDVVTIAGISGKVENINLRMTILRDLDGTVHNIPNGEIKTSSNLTKDYSKINLNIGVDYNTDLEKLERVINRVGLDLANDSNWKEKIRSAPEFLRVNELADSAIIVKIVAEVEPLEQWAVAGELRKRLKIAFDKEGIEIPFPQRVIHQAK